MKQPIISVVWTARNDDYGGHLLNRIEASVKVLIDITQQYPGLFELIIVDYNPPKNTPLLHQALHYPNHPHLPITSIIVPPELHRRFRTKIPLLEYVAKNIGIRRAKGKFVLATNPDIVFSPQLIRYLAIQSLDSNTMYRANRHDISTNWFNPTLCGQEIHEVCRQTTIKILGQGGITYISKLAWLKNILTQLKSTHLILDTLNGYRKRFQHTKDLRFIPIIGKLVHHPVTDIDAVHEIAAGDFLLMHKYLWEKVHGYDQTPLSSYYDSYIMYVLKYCFHANHQVLPFPIYHIAHNYGKGGRPESSQDEYFENIKDMHTTKKPYFMNGEWGFINEKFKIIAI